MADHEMNHAQLAERCTQVFQQMSVMLESEHPAVCCNVLLSCFLWATNGIECYKWAPTLASFLAAIAQRDGLFLNTIDLDDHEDEEGSETLH